MLLYYQILHAFMQGMITIIFFSHLYEAKVSFKKNKILFIVYLTLFIGIAFMSPSFHLLFLCLLDYGYLSFLKTKKNSIQGALLHTILFVLANILISLFRVYFLPCTVIMYIGYAVTLNILTVSIYICSLLWLRRHKYHLSLTEVIGINTAFAFLILCILIIRIFVSHLTIESLMLFYVSILLLLVIICLLARYFLKAIDKRYDLLIGNERLQQRVDIMQQSMCIIKDQQDYIKKQYHDINSHLYTITTLLEQDDRRQAIAYTNKMLQIYHTLQIDEYCNDSMVNIILSRYMAKFKTHNILFQYEILMDEPISTHNAEPFMILNYLLEQAFSSCTVIHEGNLIELQINKKGLRIHMGIAFTYPTENKDMLQMLQLFISQMEGTIKQQLTNDQLCFEVDFTYTNCTN